VAGRFALLTDDCVAGPIVDGLKRSGWDLVRVVDVFGQKSVDETVMAWATENGRAVVSTDRDCLAIGRRWLGDGRAFRLVYWEQFRYQRVAAGPFLAAFEALAANESAFSACVEYLDITRHL
jgi:hypothetical protein